MAFKDTVKNLRDLLSHITGDLEKAENGNKAASQRVRTGTVKLEKIAKLYRKESIKSEKANKGTKKPAKKTASKSQTSKAAAPKASASKASTSKAAAPKSKAPAKQPAAKVKAKPSAKATKATKTTAKARQLSFKKPTAKLPVRRHSAR